MLSVTIHETVADKRHRMGVLLHRSDYPSILKFHCPFCLNFVAELVNQVPIVMTDAIAFENTANLGTGIRCNGHCFGRGGGRVWWYFLNEGDHVS